MLSAREVVCDTFSNCLLDATAVHYLNGPRRRQQLALSSGRLYIAMPPKLVPAALRDVEPVPAARPEAEPDLAELLEVEKQMLEKCKQDELIINDKNTSAKQIQQVLRGPKFQQREQVIYARTFC